MLPQAFGQVAGEKEIAQSDESDIRQQILGEWSR